MQNRRTFIKTTGLALASAPLLASCLNAASRKPMGLQVYTLRDQLKEDLEGTLEKAANIGYTKIEVYGYENGRYFGKTAKEFQTILNNVGLKAISGHYYNGRHKPKQVGTMTNGWEKSIEDAAEIGQSYMGCGYIHEPEQGSVAMYKELCDILNIAAEKTKASGIQLFYHNHDFEFNVIDEQVPYDLLLENTDPDLVKMELDHYWVEKANQSSIDLFEKHPGRFPLWHIKDMDENGDFTEVGTGTIDYAAIFSKAELAGLDHFFVEQDEATKDRFESIKISYSNAVRLA
ncbi:MAG: sugar phosphate isomerase/epimerase [Bacteroidota bacterium]